MVTHTNKEGQGMKRVVCCKCRVMEPVDEMEQTVGCLGQIVWLCSTCTTVHHKQQIKEILRDAQAQGMNVDKWAHLLD